MDTEVIRGYKRVKSLIGKRVRVRRGTIVDIRKPGEHHDHALWCAGDVPVGSTGTIVDDPDSRCLVQIVWDHGQKPRAGYTFGLGAITHELEEILDEQLNQRCE